MMNKYKRIILLCCVVLMGGLSMSYIGGPAQSGGQAATGAPFNGGTTCGSSCHGGGSFGTTLTMQLLDASLNPVTTYTPGTAYTLRITKGGSSPRIGFQTTAAFQTSNTNINTWGALPANTHNTLLSGRNYIEHGTQLNVSVVNIPWTAPASTNTVVFYTALNAVNNDNGSGGDQVVSGNLVITTGCVTIAMTPASPPGGTVGTAYSQQLSQTGGVGTVTYALATGTMPPGVTISSTGLISGTPTTAGTYNFSITATGSNGCTSTQAFTIVIACPTITLTPAAGSLPGGTVATAYNQTIGQTGGTGTFTYTVTAGALPAGVTLNTNGTLSGTPLTAGTYTFTITGTNGTCSGSAAYTLVIGCPTITLTPASLPNGTLGTFYNQVVSQSGGGAGAYTYTIATGTLPNGLLLNTNGTISGTPTATGTFTFSITATGTQSGCSVTQSFSITINCPTITINPATLPGGTVGIAYPLSSITQTGGSGTFTYSVTTGTLPPGLNLATNGILNGTPTTPGSYTFTITGTNGTCSGSRSYTVVISCPTITVNPATLPNGTTGTAYSQTITQTGGVGVTFTVTSGTLPTGLSLAAGGALTGTPTVAGSYTFTVTGAIGTSGCTGTRTYTIVISCPTITITPATLPIGNLSVAYSQNLSQTGGSGTITYTVSSGALPGGVTLGTNGLLSGTPTASGTFTFTVTATDANGCTGTITYNWVISPCAVVTINPATLPNGTVGTAYSQTITQTGGPGTFTYTVTTGTLPTGLTLNSTTGAITGTPTTPGSYTFTITGTNGTCSGNRTYTVVIACPTITLAPATLPNGAPGTAYSQTITQTGGSGTFTYTVTSGTLPPGLTLNTNGTLSGTPTTPGTYTFTITGTNGTCSGNNAYTLIITCPTITLAPATLPDGTTGVAYSQTVTQSGSLGATFVYTVTSGALPAGVTLAANGALSGTPTAAGTYTFTITMTDNQGCTGTITYTMDVDCPTITIDQTQTSLDTAFTTSAYNETLTTTGGTAPYTYAVTSGTLPAGINMSTAGVFSGTATAPPGTYTITVTVTDANGCTATQVLDIIVFTPVSVVTVNGNKESVILLPNVVTDRTTAQIISTVTGTAELRIMDITGKVVYNTTTTLKAGENNINLDLRNLATGSYTLHVRPLKVAPVKFIKQ